MMSNFVTCVVFGLSNESMLVCCNVIYHLQILYVTLFCPMCKSMGMFKKGGTYRTEKRTRPGDQDV